MGGGWNPVRRAAGVLICAVILLAGLASSARATFPYPAPGASPGDYRQYKTPAGQIPDEWNFDENIRWKFAASPEPGNEPVNSSAQELHGVRGASVVDPDPALKTAWRVTTGRPDVTISTLDSGIKWNDRRSMVDLRKKTRLNKKELPGPAVDATAREAGVTCGGYSAGGYDVNHDGVFNVMDYACDARVEADPAARASRGQAKGVGPADLLDPQDILIAFSDGQDGYGASKSGANPGPEGNGYVDDIVGWDFLDNDNDPYDDVQYGHGTGESLDAGAEADNRQSNNDGKSVSICPNCMVIYLRVGDSFVADVNRYAQAAIYATDNDVDVIQEALGTLNNSHLAREATDYAYNHGVTVIASAADESAQHHNWPSSLPHVIVVNSVIKYQSSPVPPGDSPKSYVLFNSCTNFSAKITVAVPSKECSSDATGKGGGMAGLIYSAAKNAYDPAQPPVNPGCRRTNGDPCVITPNEVRQALASGTIAGKPLADDIDFANKPEPACFPAATPGCTDPNSNAPGNNVFFNPAGGPQQRKFPTRAGHDQFTGWGRTNLFNTVDAITAGDIPPEAEISSPDWFAQIDPAKPTLEVDGQTYARGDSYTCQVMVAPGSYPNNASTAAVPPGDFMPVPSPQCNGQPKTLRYDGKLADISLSDLKSRFPPNATGFNGREPGVGTVQTSNGRPNIEPYGFVVKVVVTKTRTGRQLTGEDRRNFYLHRDQDLLPGWPKKILSDGASSPVFADLDGDNRNELILGTSDGLVHAYRSNGTELDGWPVAGDRLALHDGDAGSAYKTGGVSDDARGAFLGSAAVGDLDHDGTPEVVAADLEGKVYAWSADGRRLFTRESNIAYSGKPLTPFEDVRKGSLNRTQHGFLASPVLADLDRNDGGRLEVIAAALDRHVYAWNDDGSTASGFPVLAIDRSKVSSIDPQTHRVNFNPAAVPDGLDQGAIVDTPAVGDISGDPRPEIVVGTNEEYAANRGNEPDYNAARINTASIEALSKLVLKPANSRVYAIKPDGYATGDAVAGSDPFVAGWPFKAAIILPGVLPVVGEGITGAPVIGPVNCPSGGSGPKVGLMPDAGPAFILNPDASSCYGKESGKDIGLQTDTPTGSASPPRYDSPSFPALGHPAFGDLGDGVSFFGPTIGLFRALDLQVREYQPGQDFIGSWNTQTGQYRPGFPVPVNDLQFLTGPSIADIDGLPGQEVLEGTASLDLAGLNAAGAPINARWPKLTGDWTVANPLIGSFGTRDTDPGARKVVFMITRSGYMFTYKTDAPACSPGSWPRFHHDNANSGDYRRDAVLPGKPALLTLAGSTLSFDAPGDDGLCGTATRYEVVSSDGEITPASFDSAANAAQAPGGAGSREAVAVPGSSRRRVAVRAVDDQGNVGRIAIYDKGLPGGGPDAKPPLPGARDVIAPVASLRAPRYASDQSPSSRFRVSWRGTDEAGGSGIDSYRVEVRRVGTRPWRTVAARTAKHTATFGGVPGVAYTFRIRATDRAGNAGAFSFARTAVPLDERSRRVAYSRGGWQRVRASRTFGGTVMRPLRRGAGSVLRFHGSHVGVVATRRPRGGRLLVIVDGHRSVVSTRGARTQVRRVIYRSGVLRGRTHTVKVIALGGAAVELDAFGIEP